MAKYRKKPVVIEGVRFTDTSESINALLELGLDTVRIKYSRVTSPELRIETLEGVMCAQVGDYIIRGVNGEFYPCKPDIFEKTYEAVQ